MASKTKIKNPGKIYTLRILSVLLLASTLGSGYQYVEGLKEDGNQKSLATNIAYIGQNLLRASTSAVERIDEGSFKTLSDGQDRFSYDVGVITKGGVLPSGNVIPSPNGNQTTQINALKDIAGEISNNVNFILNEKSDLMTLKGAVAKYNVLVKSIMDRAKNLAGMDGVDTDPKIQITLAKIYTDLGSVESTSFGDDKGILQDDYLSNQTATAQMILNHVKELASLSSQVARLPNGERLTKEANTLYTLSQDLKDNVNLIINTLPNRITAKKYVSETDSISGKLSDAYTSVNFTLTSSQSAYEIWMYVTIASILALLLSVVILLRTEVKSRIPESNQLSTKTKKDFTDKFDNALNKFFTNNSRLNKSIQIDIPYSKIYSGALMKLKDIATLIDKERSNYINTVKDIQLQSGNMKGMSHEIKEEDFSNSYKLKTEIADPLKIIMTKFEENDKRIQDLDIDTLQVSDSLTKTTSTIAKIKKIKESMQESAKRVKKLGESSQSISEITDEVRAISGKLQVIALNSSIVANESNSETNKKFSAFSIQIEKMAEDLTEVMNKADDTLKEILDNSQETIKAVEGTTKDLLMGSNSIVEVNEVLMGYKDSLFESKRKVSEVAKINQQGLNELNKTISILKQIDSGREDLNSKRTSLNLQIESLNEKLSEFLRDLND